MKDAKEPPGCIAQTEERHTTLERVERKVKDKCIRDLNTSKVSSESSEATAVGVGGLATRKHSVGADKSL